MPKAKHHLGKGEGKSHSHRNKLSEHKQAVGVSHVNYERHHGYESTKRG
jgi:hypothetical protein